MVLAFAFAVALLTGIIFGSAPAWFCTRTAPAEALRGLNRSTSDHSSLARNTLLIIQTTVSVVLVAGATMLARSLDNLEHQNLGYADKNRIAISLNSPPATYTLLKLNSLYRELERRLDSLPGVRDANFALYNPLTDNWGEAVLISGHPAPGVGQDVGSSWDRVSANYVQDFGIALKRGRNFTTADNENTAPVAIVNEAFVKRFFKSHEYPLDQHFGLDLVENANTFRIVGVTQDAKFAGFALNQPARPMFFVPLAQNVGYKNAIMKRIELQSHFIGGIMLLTNASPGMLEPLVTRALAAVDPNLTINSIRTMQQQVDLTFDQERAVASPRQLIRHGGTAACRRGSLWCHCLHRGPTNS